MLEELQHGQKPHDDFQPVDQARGERPEADGPDTGQLLDQFAYRVGDGSRHGADMVEIERRLGLGGEGPTTGVAQGLYVHARQQIGSEIDEAVLDTRHARVRPAGGIGTLAKHARRVLEGLALDQAGEQEVTLLEEGQLVVEVESVVDGEQPAGLQLDERGRDQQELGRDLEVAALHSLELAQVRVDDVRKRDVVQVDFLGQDQVQEKVEGPLEDLGFDRVGHGPDRIPGGANSPRPWALRCWACPRPPSSGSVTISASRTTRPGQRRPRGTIGSFRSSSSTTGS